MEITTTGRRFQADPRDQGHGGRSASPSFSRYSDLVREAHLVLAQEKYRHIAELTLHGGGTELTSREETAEMASSIDRVGRPDGAAIERS